ncbi:MAG: hypothetical protein ISF22_01055 [Methanomassiliicoccus sp.]|nr:hypothetical protein [Methanomassiliicoccus sp.]
MRLKKQYLALIVVVMLVLTGLLASWIVGSVQGAKVAYVAVRADKSEFGMDENVTFSLVPLSQDVQFTVSGEHDSAGVYIVRLADDIDPDTYLDDSNAVQNISVRARSDHEPVIPIPRYNSSGEPMRMSWNRTIPQYDAERGGYVWYKATEGTYLLYPVYQWEYGHATKFMLERASIFHLDGLRVDHDISLDDSVFTVRTEFSLPEGAGPMSGLFTTILPRNPDTFNSTMTYHNETVELVPGQTTTVTITYPASGSYGPVTTSMSAFLIVGDITYAFGFWPYIIYDHVNNNTEVRYVQY